MVVVVVVVVVLLLLLLLLLLLPSSSSTQYALRAVIVCTHAYVHHAYTYGRLCLVETLAVWS